MPGRPIESACRAAARRTPSSGDPPSGDPRAPAAPVSAPWDAALAGLVAGYGIAMPVGAVATYLVTLTARTSARVGGAAALGVATADGVYALIAVVGGAALTGLIEAVATPLRWVAVAVLVAVAVRIAWTAIRDHRQSAADDRPVPAGAVTGPGRAFLTFLGITLLNPATIVYFAALVLGSRATGDSAGGGGVFVVAVFLASASWQLLLVAGGTMLGRLVTGRTGRLVIGLVSSAVILALTAMLILTG